MTKQFTDAQFEKFQSLIYENFGIALNKAKKELLHARLVKLLGQRAIASYDEYYQLLLRDGQALAEFADAITVNKTDFFREINHFNFLRQQMKLITTKNPRILQRGEIRVWSAACSTGEEPYTLAMVLKEALPEGVALRILATDINRRALGQAVRGIYPATIKDEVDRYYMAKYFRKHAEGYEVLPELRACVTFCQFNLMHPFPFKNPLDIIFCRNVMIYFDTVVQQKLIHKFYQVLSPGGLLFLGHSESLSGKEHRFSYLQPTIYIK